MVEEKKSEKRKIQSLTVLEKILIIVIVVLIASLTILMININKNPKEVGIQNLNETQVDDYCKSNILIDKIMFRTLKSEILDGPRNYEDIVSLWKDGSFIQKAPKWQVENGIVELKCYTGKPENGENENYFYCNNIYYTKTISNIQGESLENEEYMVDLILDRNNYTVAHNHVPGWTSQLDLITTNNVVDAVCRKL